MGKLDNAELRTGGAKEELQKLSTESVSVCITSPPYFGLRDYHADGQIGLEESLEDYIQNLANIFDQVHRVLHPKGTLWLNLGDSYSGSGGPGGDFRDGKGGDTYKRQYDRSPLKKKDLCMVPSRVAMELQRRGWWLRSEIIWCLSGDTPMVCRVDGEIQFMDISEVHELEENKNVEIQTRDKDGAPVWVDIIDTQYNGKKEVDEIELTDGTTVRATENHEFPIRRSTIRRNSSPRRIKLKSTGQLEEGKDFLYKTSRIKRSSSNKRDGGWKEGFFCGVYLAEGHKVNSGYDTIDLTLGDKDKDIIEKFEEWGISFNIKDYDDRKAKRLRLHLRNGGRKWRDLVYSLIKGRRAETKHFSDEVFNKSKNFLEGLLKGYLKGDGWKDGDRWRVGLTAKNEKLIKQINALCLLLGKEFRRSQNYMVEAFGKQHEVARFTIKEYNSGVRKGAKGKIVENGLTCRKIRNIKRGVEKTDVYDISIKPIYTGGKNSNQYTKEELKESKQRRLNKWNHLYFLGNGVWTHNCKAVSFCDGYTGTCMPQSAKDRPTNSHEKLFLLSKSKDYFYDEEVVAQPIADQSRIGEVRGNSGHSARGEEKVNQINPGQGVMKPTKKLRDVWTFNPASFSSEGTDHFATFPLGLIEPCVKAGSPLKGVCSKCGSPFERKTEVVDRKIAGGSRSIPKKSRGAYKDRQGQSQHDRNGLTQSKTKTKGFKPTCDCDTEPKPATVLDPFSGAATTGIAALKHGRKYIGIDVNEDYNELAKKRIRDHKEVPTNHSFW